MDKEMMTPTQEIQRIVTNTKNAVEQIHRIGLDESIIERLTQDITALMLRAATEICDVDGGHIYPVKRTATIGQTEPTPVYEPVSMDGIFSPCVNMPVLKAICAKVKECVTRQIGNFSYTYWFIFHKVLLEVGLLEEPKQTLFISWVNQVFGWPWATRDFKHVGQGFKHTSTEQWNDYTTKDLLTCRQYADIVKQLRSLLITGKGDHAAYAPDIVREGLYMDYKTRRKV